VRTAGPLRIWRADTAGLARPMVLRRASSARGRDIVMPQPDTIVPPRSPSKPALRTRRRHTSPDNCTTHGALAVRKTWRLSRDRRLRFGAARARLPALRKIIGCHSLRAGLSRLRPDNERLFFLNIRGLGHFGGRGKFASIGAGHEDCA
jgi:hypothetical protein